jgi:chemotaxis protein MotB
VALGRGRRSYRHIDYWPGFVDALSTLLLAIMFLLSVFVLAQFLLSREISGKDEALNRLNAQINELTQLLALERGNVQDAQDALANLQASLSASEAEKSRLEQLLAAGEGTGRAATASARSASGRCRRSSCSTSRSPRCAARSRRSSRRSTPRRRATANPTPRSPTSGAG